MTDMTITPLCVGLLQDLAFGPDNIRLSTDCLTMAFEETRLKRLLERPLEIVTREPHGLPPGSTHAVLCAARELVGEGVLCNFGPSYSENAFALRDNIEHEAQVPALAW